MSDFENLLGSMKRLNCTYDDLDEKDKEIYDNLKRKHDEVNVGKFGFSIKNFPSWVNSSSDKLTPVFSDIAKHFRDYHVKFVFGEFSSVFEYRLFCLLFKSLCKELNLRHCVYVEPQFDGIENYLGAETVGLFSGRQIELRHEGVLSHLLWQRQNEGYHTFVFTVREGPKYEKFSTSIQDYFPSFHLDQEDMILSFKNREKRIQWTLKQD